MFLKELKYLILILLLKFQVKQNMTFLCMFLGMISILSNIIVLGIFVKYKELRTSTNAIIINLAVTDIGVSSIGYPMSAASDLYGRWKFGYAGCQVLDIFGMKAK